MKELIYSDNLDRESFCSDYRNVCLAPFFLPKLKIWLQSVLFSWSAVLHEFSFVVLFQTLSFSSAKTRIFQTTSTEEQCSFSGWITETFETNHAAQSASRFKTLVYSIDETCVSCLTFSSFSSATRFWIIVFPSLYVLLRDIPPKFHQCVGSLKVPFLVHF